LGVYRKVFEANKSLLDFFEITSFVKDAKGNEIVGSVEAK